MTLTFYFGSGSPFAWKVWLVLEHKEIAYTAKRLSFDNDDTKSPEFLRVNPRGRVPAIVDDGFALYESGAICEYLEEKYPHNPLLPKDVRERATIRRMIGEADNYLYLAGSALMEQTLYVSPSERDPKRIEEARAKVVAELPLWERALAGEFFAGALSLADFVIYPYMRMPVRVEERAPGQGIKRTDLPRNIAAWMKRIEALPYFERTIPPHWKG